MNIISGVLILVVGFCFHWIGQLISVFNWDLAVKIGLQEKGMPPEFKVYEKGIAAADALLGWIYGLAGLGLIWGTPWGFRLAWFPGVVLLYHGCSFWFWSRNQKRAGYDLRSGTLRIGWVLANGLTGLLTIWVAWNGCAS
jgi:hypothetical protein